jgi:anthranilate synthase component 1
MPTSHRYNRIAVIRELPGDLDTPVGAYLKIANQPYTYLLESVHGGEQWGRYSFIGLPSREVLRVHGHQISVSRDGVEVERAVEQDVIGWVRAYAARYRVRPEPGLPRFAGGLVGYFGYDCVRYFEPRLAATQKPDALGTPDILLMLADELVVFDTLRATLTLVVHADPNDAADLARAQKRLDEIEAQLARPQTLPLTKLPTQELPELPFTTSFPHAQYLEAVARVKEYIAAGDTMQAQIGQRLSAPFHAEPVALYRAIRRLNPSPYLYCMNLGDHHVVGSSPEILVRVQDGELTLRPIAGTRKRGATVQEDEALAAELLADPKERAEHLMLIDLGRNDVGRVSEVGVRVTDQMVIERYSHVMHIVSNVTGRLKPGLDGMDALAATFPAGTLTGAPKVRTMEIIDELEPVKRGIYGGAVGYLGWDGNMDMAIAIRTAVIKDGQIHVQASAGIVADSVPESEWQETLQKARAMMKAAAQAGAAS